MHDDRVYKLKQGYGFFKWSAFIRNVGIERNELLLIDYFTWLMCITFGWVNWLSFQKKENVELFPEIGNTSSEGIR